MTDIPRIASVSSDGARIVLVEWRDGGRDRIDLSGWIATGGLLLAPLNERKLFARAHVAEHGFAVAWDDEDDLAIDAAHLQRLAAEQRRDAAE